MIEKLDHSKPVTASEIYEVFQASYAVEARLLRAEYFPPLLRTAQDLKKSKNEFWAYYKKDAIVAISEIKVEPSLTHIQSLVVLPSHFRKGIAGKMILHVFNFYQSKSYIVETGLENNPAIMLYKKYGFDEILQYDTEYGIRKIRLECLDTNQSKKASRTN